MGDEGISARFIKTPTKDKLLTLELLYIFIYFFKIYFYFLNKEELLPHECQLRCKACRKTASGHMGQEGIYSRLAERKDNL